jgi:hypothetical protein
MNLFRCLFHARVTPGDQYIQIADRRDGVQIFWRGSRL